MKKKKTSQKKSEIFQAVYKKFEDDLRLVESIVDYSSSVVDIALGGYQNIKNDTWYKGEVPANIKKYIDNSVTVLENIEKGNNSRDRFGGLLFKLGISQLIGFFESFLKDLWTDVIKKAPGMLVDDSKLNVTSKDLLSIQSGDREPAELILDSFNQKQLRFLGVSGIIKSFKFIKIDVNSSFQASKLEIDKLFALRHAILHSGGKKDQKYLKMTNEPSKNDGKPINISQNELSDATKLVKNISKKILDASKKAVHKIKV